MTNFYLLLKYLFKTNKLLSTRTRQRVPFLYFGLILLFSIITGSILIFGLFSYINISDNQELLIFITSVIFLIIILDVLLSMIRFQHSTAIEPLHLLVFPISNFEVYIVNLFIFIVDYKIIIYLTSLIIISIYFIIYSNATAIIFLIPLFLLFTISVNLYLFIIYTVIYRFLNKIRHSAIIIPIILIAINNILIASESMEATTFIPILNILSNGLLYLIQGEFLNAVYTILSTALILLAGLVIITILSKYERAQYVRY